MSPVFLVGVDVVISCGIFELSLSGVLRFHHDLTTLEGQCCHVVGSEPAVVRKTVERRKGTSTFAGPLLNDQNKSKVNDCSCIVQWSEAQRYSFGLSLTGRW